MYQMKNIKKIINFQKIKKQIQKKYIVYKIYKVDLKNNLLDNLYIKINNN